MLGEENSTIIFLGLLIGVKASDKLWANSEPYLLPRSRIYGMASWGKNLRPKLLQVLQVSIALWEDFSTLRDFLYLI